MLEGYMKSLMVSEWHLLDIGTVRVPKPVLALDDAGHGGEFSLAPISII